MNLNKTKALVVSRSRTVNPPHGDLVLSVVSISASPNLDILGVKLDSRLTFEDHVRGIISSVSQRICILRLLKTVFVDTSVLFRVYYALDLPILEYCSSVWWSAAECHLQLLERRVCSVARLCPDQIRLSDFLLLPSDTSVSFILLPSAGTSVSFILLPSAGTSVSFILLPTSGTSVSFILLPSSGTSVSFRL